MSPWATKSDQGMADLSDKHIAFLKKTSELVHKRGELEFLRIC